MSVYQADNTYSSAGVFVGFLKSFSPIASDSGETKLSAEVSSYSKLMNEQSLADDIVPQIYLRRATKEKFAHFKGWQKCERDSR